MKYSIALVLALLSSAVVAQAAESAKKEAGVSSSPAIQAFEYHKAAEKLDNLRESRKVDMTTITRMMQDKNTILLDTRGDADFNRLHIRGAKHLSYADMTTDRLAEMFPDKNTRIIVYCDAAIMSPMTRMMPLSSNAFVDMHMYGYTNVYEMRSMMTIQPHQQRCQEILDIPFEGDSAVVAEKKRNSAYRSMLALETQAIELAENNEKSRVEAKKELKEAIAAKAASLAHAAKAAQVQAKILTGATNQKRADREAVKLAQRKARNLARSDAAAKASAQQHLRG